MTKYQFQCDEIKTCGDCPFYDEHSIDCGRNVSVSSFTIPSEVGCPLVKVEENIFNNNYQLMDQRMIVNRGQPNKRKRRSNI